MVKVIFLPYIFPGFVCFVLYWAKISGERLQDHWSSGMRVIFLCYFHWLLYMYRACFFNILRGH